MSQPINSGAESRHQRLICVYCSSGLNFVLCRLGPQPTLPTISMSGSLKCPGCANGAGVSCLNPIDERLPQESLISPVVRQLFPPTSGPHFHTSPMPYWQRLKMMSLFVFASASCITSYGFL